MSNKKRKIAVVEGDGVGPEVIRSALAILDAVCANLEIVPVELGFGRWKRTGKAMTDEEVDLIEECGCVLFGAITTPPDPNYKSVLVTLRKELDLYANLRPFVRGDIDLLIVRENTEGLYSGIEEVGTEEARTVRLITRKGCERIAEKACELTSKRKKLTIVHKSNVLKSDTLFLEVCKKRAQRWNIPHDTMLVDAMAYNLVLRPQDFDVLVTTNLFGDILSDECAGVIGGLGLCPSANLGDRYALFEPIHGSAPDIAGKGIANPIGAIRSAGMMLEWMKDWDKARRIEEAVLWSIQKGIVTPDLGGRCTTEEVTERIVGYLKSQEP
jgi:methanogen homoisocitrate dehydrogenase